MPNITEAGTARVHEFSTFITLEIDGAGEVDIQKGPSIMDIYRALGRYIGQKRRESSPNKLAAWYAGEEVA